MERHSLLQHLVKGVKLITRIYGFVRNNADDGKELAKVRKVSTNACANYWVTIRKFRGEKRCKLGEET